MTASSRSYEASRINRVRASKSEVQARRQTLHAIIAEQHPMTVRQAFYQAAVRGLVEKDETGYDKLQGDLTRMRLEGLLPYDWLTDSTRRQRKPASFASVEDALEETTRFYREALWNSAASYVEIWIENDALAGVLYPVTALYDVSLMSARGYASLSFLHEAATYIGLLDRPAFVYHLGDFDPSGVDASAKIEQRLREFAPDANITFERLAVTEPQIADWRLPIRPTRKPDGRSKRFGEVSVELDAIPPGDLRALLEQAIHRHLPQDQLEVLKIAEANKCELITSLVGRMGSRHG
jgi:hypothetical protein